MVEWRVELYVTPGADASERAIRALDALSRSMTGVQIVLEVIDSNEQPELLRGRGVVITPTLIRTSPGPIRRVAGELGDVERLRRELDAPARLRTEPSPSRSPEMNPRESF